MAKPQQHCTICQCMPINPPLALTEHIANSVSSLITHFAQQLDRTIPAVLAGHLTVSSRHFFRIGKARNLWQ